MDKKHKKRSLKNFNSTESGQTRSASSGQAMMMTVLIVGGLLLVASSVAGLLMFYQLRQSTNFSESVKAYYAADAALEKAMYDYFQTSKYITKKGTTRCRPSNPCSGGSIKLSNGAVGEIPVIQIPESEKIKQKIEIVTRGKTRRAVRSLKTTFLITPSRPKGS